MFKRIGIVVLMLLVVSGSVLAGEADTMPNTAEEDQSALVCPGQSNGNQAPFNVYSYTDLFVVQTNTTRTVRVNVTLNSGSASAEVRLRNVSTGAITSSLHFQNSGYKDITVGCGDWIVQVASGHWWYRAHGSVSAYPQ